MDHQHGECHRDNVEVCTIGVAKGSAVACSQSKCTDNNRVWYTLGDQKRDTDADGDDRERRSRCSMIMVKRAMAMQYTAVAANRVIGRAPGFFSSFPGYYNCLPHVRASGHWRAAWMYWNCRGSAGLSGGYCPLSEAHFSFCSFLFFFSSQRFLCSIRLFLICFLLHGVQTIQDFHKFII